MFYIRRKQREESATADKGTKKRKAPTPAKKPAAKKAKEVPQPKKKDADEDEVPDTAGDEELARKLEGKRESTRNRDTTGKTAQKAKALAEIRKVRYGCEYFVHS